MSRTPMPGSWSPRSAGTRPPARRSTSCTPTWRWSGPAVLGALGERRAARAAHAALGPAAQRRLLRRPSTDGGGSSSPASPTPRSRGRRPRCAGRSSAPSRSSVPIPEGRPAPPRGADRLGPRAVPAVRVARASTSRCGPAERPACRWCSPDRSVACPTAQLSRRRSPTRRARCAATPTSAGSSSSVAPQLDGDRARWIGSVSGAEKADLLRRSRAVLFPIRWEEPGGTAVCEALAAGTPVVAMARGCLPVARRARPSPASSPTTRRASPRRWAGWASSIPQACAADGPTPLRPAVMADGYDKLYAELLHRAAAHPRPAGEEEE